LIDLTNKLKLVLFSEFERKKLKQKGVKTKKAENKKAKLE